MNKKQAKDCLRDFLKTGCIQPTRHCRESMKKRNVNMDDILNVVFWGKIEELKYDSDHDSWNCRLKGKDIEGEPLVFVAAIYENCHIVRCITVF